MEKHYEDDEEIMVINFSEEETAKLDMEYQEQTRQFLQATEPYRLGRWYPALEEFTFRTISFQLRAGEAFALFQLYYQESINQQCQQALRQLEARVNACLSQNFPEGCFPKLSTRSPKDYCWDFRDQSYFSSTVLHLTEFMTQHLCLHKVKEPRELTLLQANSIYKFLMENSRQRSRIRHGKDFIKLFSKSERVVIDLEQLSTAGGHFFRRFKEGDWSKASENLIDVCFREWKDFLWQNQFRCFYNEYKLTAICPYEQDCYFEQWVGRESELRDRLSTYFGKLEPSLRKCGLSKGVIDIFFTNDESGIGMIEVNPFDANTRASLFNWEKDKQQLTAGQQIQVRINSAPTARIHDKMRSIMGMLEKRSIDVVKTALQNTGGSIILT